MHPPLGTPPVYARCGACAAAFTRQAWLALHLAETLTPARIAHHVVAWPEAQRIEVRRCSACGGGIARKGVAA